MIEAYDNLAKTQKALCNRHPIHRRFGPGPIRLAAVVDSYVVVRRPGAALFLMARDAFDSLPLCDKEGKLQA